MFAPRWIRVGICGLVGSALAGFMLPATAEPQAKKSNSGAYVDPGKPAFFVEWTASGPPPGMTERPSPDKNTAPDYPAESAKRHESGRTKLTVCVTAAGRLVDVHITQSSGFARLDEATLAWSRAAKYKPARINGEPVNVCGYALEYDWRLDE